jgi:RNA polymerase sigma-70 factor (ECF subfamily)
MSEAPIDTVWLQSCVKRWRGGDQDAADCLFREVGQRLEVIARKMLRAFPVLRGCAETGDVLQGSLVRLLNTLRRLQPESTRHFFNLAAVHVRRELLDLARRFSGRGRVPLAADSTGAAALQAAAAPTEDDDFDLWCRFHEAVERLPDEEREVIDLVFYHGWTQAQIAELLEITERTVRRRWRSACLQLNRLVGDKLPRP